eukprot:MONOS_9543.1-p1 / transcript=MONOS_9543.1 / gene=MONOS_9543 / organism=Monocercomonoides_exilis_PA203 / gene_product=unspecified product / transcript_product=unspecified product / location=Mono_scaffold00398:20946-25893(-) / protein_length=1491 / sequence_SO=supercontig / SO=protein_coding / is_pseudo=false
MKIGDYLMKSVKNGNYSLSCVILQVYQVIAQEKQLADRLIAQSAQQTLFLAWGTAEENQNPGYSLFLREMIYTYSQLFEYEYHRSKLAMIIPRLFRIFLVESHSMYLRILAIELIIKSVTPATSTVSSISSKTLPSYSATIENTLLSILPQLHKIGDYRLQTLVLKLTHLLFVSSTESSDLSSLNLQHKQFQAEVKKVLIEMVNDSSLVDAFSLMQTDSLEKDIASFLNILNTHPSLAEERNIFLFHSVLVFPRKSFGGVEVTMGKYSITLSFPTRRDSLQHGCTIERKRQMKKCVADEKRRKVLIWLKERRYPPQIVSLFLRGSADDGEGDDEEDVGEEEKEGGARAGTASGNASGERRKEEAEEKAKRRNTSESVEKKMEDEGNCLLIEFVRKSEFGLFVQRVMPMWKAMDDVKVTTKEEEEEEEEEGEEGEEEKGAMKGKNKPSSSFDKSSRTSKPKKSAAAILQTVMSQAFKTKQVQTVPKLSQQENDKENERVNEKETENEKENENEEEFQSTQSLMMQQSQLDTQFSSSFSSFASPLPSSSSQPTTGTDAALSVLPSSLHLPFPQSLNRPHLRVKVSKASSLEFLPPHTEFPLPPLPPPPPSPSHLSLDSFNSSSASQLNRSSAQLPFILPSYPPQSPSFLSLSSLHSQFSLSSADSSSLSSSSLNSLSQEIDHYNELSRMEQEGANYGRNDKEDVNNQTGIRKFEGAKGDKEEEYDEEEEEEEDDDDDDAASTSIQVNILKDEPTTKQSAALPASLSQRFAQLNTLSQQFQPKQPVIVPRTQTSMNSGSASFKSVKSVAKGMNADYSRQKGQTRQERQGKEEEKEEQPRFSRRKKKEMLPNKTAEKDKNDISNEKIEKRNEKEELSEEGEKERREFARSDKDDKESEDKEIDISNEKSNNYTSSIDKLAVHSETQHENEETSTDQKPSTHFNSSFLPAPPSSPPISSVSAFSSVKQSVAVASTFSQTPSFEPRRPVLRAFEPKQDEIKRENRENEKSSDNGKEEEEEEEEEERNKIQKRKYAKKRQQKEKVEEEQEEKKNEEKGLDEVESQKSKRPRGRPKGSSKANVNVKEKENAKSKAKAKTKAKAQSKRKPYSLKSTVSTRNHSNNGSEESDEAKKEEEDDDNEEESKQKIKERKSKKLSENDYLKGSVSKTANQKSKEKTDMNSELGERLHPILLVPKRKRPRMKEVVLVPPGVDDSFDDDFSPSEAKNKRKKDQKTKNAKKEETESEEEEERSRKRLRVEKQAPKVSIALLVQGDREFVQKEEAKMKLKDKVKKKDKEKDKEKDKKKKGKKEKENEMNASSAENEPSDAEEGEEKMKDGLNEEETLHESKKSNMTTPLGRVTRRIDELSEAQLRATPPLSLSPHPSQLSAFDSSHLHSPIIPSLQSAFTHQKSLHSSQLTSSSINSSHTLHTKQNAVVPFDKSIELHGGPEIPVSESLIKQFQTSMENIEKALTYAQQTFLFEKEKMSKLFHFFSFDE